jgi:hypothetical protein
MLRVMLDLTARPRAMVIGQSNAKVNSIYEIEESMGSLPDGG